MAGSPPPRLNRKVLNKLLYLGSLLALLAAGFGTPAPATPHNVIFVLCDDLGIGDIGVFFQNSRKTNNLRSEPWHLTPAPGLIGQ
jgi:hypothetical protein